MLTETEKLELAELEKKFGNKAKEPSKKGIGNYAAMAGRSLASVPGYLADIVNLPGNLIQKGINKVVGLPDDEDYSYGESTKKAIDKATHNYAKPESKEEKLAEAAFDVLGPGKIKSIKTAVKAAKAAASRIPSISGSVAGQHIINEDPKNVLGATAANILTTVAAAKSPTALKKLKSIHENTQLARIKKNPELKQKIIEKIGNEAGGRKIERIDNKEAGLLAQEAAKNYIGKKEKTFKRAFERPSIELEHHTEGMSNANRHVSTKEAVDFALNKYGALEKNALKKDFLQTETGKQLQLMLDIPYTTNVQKFERELIKKQHNPSLTIPEAETVRRGIGEQTSKFGVLGNTQKGNLETMSGLLEESLGKKYLEASPGSYRKWKFAKKHYSSHKNKNEPIVNEILKKQDLHKPIEAFRKTTKDLGKDATSAKFISQYLKGNKKHEFHQGLISELAQKEGKFNIQNFSKKLNELPGSTKKLVLKGLQKSDLKELGHGLKRVKTLAHIENKKGITDVLKNFVPYKIEKFINPVASIRNYGPKHIEKTYELLKKKAHTPYKTSEKFKIHQHPGMIRDLINFESKKGLTHEEQIELHELEKKFGKKSHHAKGDIVNPNTHDPYDSDKSNDEDTHRTHRNDITTQNFEKHHLARDQGIDLSDRIIRIASNRYKDESANYNTVLGLTRKWENKLLKRFKNPKFQEKLKKYGIATIRKPIKAIVYETMPMGKNSFASRIPSERKSIKLTVRGHPHNRDKNGDVIISHYESHHDY